MTLLIRLTLRCVLSNILCGQNISRKWSTDASLYTSHPPRRKETLTGRRRNLCAIHHHASSHPWDIGLSPASFCGSDRSLILMSARESSDSRLIVNPSRAESRLDSTGGDSSKPAQPHEITHVRCLKFGNPTLKGCVACALPRCVCPTQGKN